LPTIFITAWHLLALKPQVAEGVGDNNYTYLPTAKSQMEDLFFFSVS
jgi:hypothetical protein